MILRAKEKADKLKSLRNSITHGVGNFAGYLGEETLSFFLDAEIISCDDGEEKYNHDLLFEGKKIEVKTQRRTVAPLMNYDVNLDSNSKHQNPDIYAFVSIECGKIIDRDPIRYKGIKIYGYVDLLMQIHS